LELYQRLPALGDAGASVLIETDDDTVTVATLEAKVADMPAPTKLIVPAVPIVVPSSLITIPLPDTCPAVIF